MPDPIRLPAGNPERDRPARVLITRPQPGAEETARAVVALGLQAVIAPLQTIEAVPVRLPRPDRVAGLVLTSGNAIAAIPPAWFGVPVWAVGDATARRALAAGFTRVSSAAGDAADLVELIGRHNEAAAPALGRGERARGRTLLLATGAGVGGPIAAMLRARGFRIIRRVAYRTRSASVLPPDALGALTAPASTQADTPGAGSPTTAGMLGVLFFSAEAVRVFTRLVQAAGAADATRTCEAFAISSAAAVALPALPWRAIHVAGRPTQDAMLAMLR